MIFIVLCCFVILCLPKYQRNVSIPSGIEVYPIKVNRVIFNLVKVEGGSFIMGDFRNQSNYADEIEHQVTLDDYYMCQTEVTEELWNTVMGYKIDKKTRTYPIKDISWEDCKVFITKLNHLTGLEFRLPTEAEWEYAARGGKYSHAYIYSGGNDLDAIAWYENNSDGDRYKVAQKLPNELGIYDMTGNVWEWCQDYYGPYDVTKKNNPQGSTKGHSRVRRGGCWQDSFTCLHTSFRSSMQPMKFNNMGLRLVVSELMNVNE